MTATTEPRRGSMAEALSVQCRVIIALVLRELVQEFGQSRAAIFWLLFRPAFLIFLFYSLSLLYHRLTPQGMSLMTYLVTGWSAYFLFMRNLKDTSGNVKGGANLLMFPHMTALDIFIAQAIMEWFVYNFVFFLLVIFALLIERSPPPANPMAVMMAYWSCGLIGSMVSLILASLARIAPAVDHLALPIRRLGHFISGVIVTAADTPTSFLQYISWNPLLHAIELMRESWWPAYVSPVADPWYLFRCILFLLAMGLALERATRKYITL